MIPTRTRRSNPEKAKTAGMFLAPKPAFSISQPGDAAEQEAETISERVVCGGSMGLLSGGTVAGQPAIQRKCAHCEQEEKAKNIQRKESSAAVPATSSFALKSQLDSSQGQGNALPRSTRQKMEQAFGTDLGNVRLHTDSQAATLSRKLNAHAFTYGQDVYFNTGQYNPQSTEGHKLLAHELTHVVQQTGSVQRKQIQRQAAPDVAPTPGLYEMTDEDWAEAARETQAILDHVLEPYRRNDATTFLNRLRGLSAWQATWLANSDEFFNAIGGTFRGRSLWIIFNILWFNNHTHEPYLRLNSAIYAGDAQLVTDMLSIVILHQHDDRYFEMLRRALTHAFRSSPLLAEMLRLIDHRTDAGISQRHDATYDEVHYEKNTSGTRALTTMTGNISANSYISGSNLRVIVRLRFVDNTGQPFYFLGDNATVYDRWLQAITSTWNNKFTATNGVNTLNVVFVPLFLSEADSQAYTIRIMTDPTLRCAPSLSPGRSEQSCWFLNVSDRTVAHEFGHLLGASDEYSLPGIYQEVRNAGITLSPDDMMASTVEGIRGTARPVVSAGYDIPGLMGSGSTAVETRHLSRLMRLINAGLPAGTPVFQLRSRS